MRWVRPSPTRKQPTRKALDTIGAGDVPRADRSGAWWLKRTMPPPESRAGKERTQRRDQAGVVAIIAGTLERVSTRLRLGRTPTIASVRALCNHQLLFFRSRFLVVRTLARPPSERPRPSGSTERRQRLESLVGDLLGSDRLPEPGVDPTVVSPAAIWVSRAVVGRSCRARSGRTGSRAPRSAASGR